MKLLVGAISRVEMSEPSGTFEANIEHAAKCCDHTQSNKIAVFHSKFGHVLEVHTIDSGNRCRHGENGGPGGKLSCDGALPLLFQQVACFEDRRDDIAQAPHHLLDAVHVLQGITKIGFCLDIEAGPEVEELRARTLALGPNAGASERGTILALLGSIERAEILIRRIDAERKSVNRQRVLARAATRQENRGESVVEGGFSPVPAE